MTFVLHGAGKEANHCNEGSYPRPTKVRGRCGLAELFTDRLRSTIRSHVVARRQESSADGCGDQGAATSPRRRNLNMKVRPTSLYTSYHAYNLGIGIDMRSEEGHVF